jgi:plastocyanin
MTAKNGIGATYLKNMKKSVSILLFFLGLSCSAGMIGCNKSSAPERGQTAAPPAPQSSPVNVDKSTLGSISGVISFKGAAPKLAMIDPSADPACPTDRQPSDAIVVQNGKLANVFVYIKSGLNGSVAASSDPVVINQKGCRYVPHVVGLMIGQPFKVLNDDNAQHNVHPMPRQNDEWNESQMPRGEPIVKTFRHPEIMMPVQCNQHPWMQMYVNVVDNPYFAVSGEDGSFQIKDLPPGEYTLAVVHEKFGEQTMKITVAPKQTASASFAFSAGAR